MRKKELVVFNPMIENMLGQKLYKFLVELLEKDGYIVTDSLPGAMAVRKQYKDYFLRTNKSVVIDSRCPAIRQLIDEEFPELTGKLAPIDSILITGAKMRWEQYNSDDDNLRRMIIVAPCTYFKEINEPNITVMTWLEFTAAFYKLHLRPHYKPDSTPVPLGFFDYLKIKVRGTSGENSCRRLLRAMPPDTQLLELLYCQGGCHNGNGF